MAKRKVLRKIKAKRGVDPKLERQADAILKADRQKTKAADAEKIRAARIEALNNPSKTIQELRLARQKKKIATELRAKLRDERFKRLLAEGKKSKVSQAEKIRLAKEYGAFKKIAKREGRKSGVKLAKSAVTEKKQFLVSSSAKALNASANRVRQEVQNKRWTAARNVERTASPRQFKKLTGMRKKNSVRTLTVARELEARGHLPELKPLRQRVELLKGLSKDQARISGGLRTGAERQIMSAQRATMAGKNARRMSKAVGARIGLAGFLVAASGHLFGKDSKKKRG
jgi:hypothetical protein